jgi:hypothetical protein
VLWRTTRGKVLAQSGEIEAGQLLVCDAVELTAETDNYNLQADSQFALAVVYRAGGLHGEARTAIAKAIERYEQKGNLASRQRAVAFSAEIALPLATRDP